MSHPIDIFSRAVATVPEASILPHPFVESAVSIATQFGIAVVVIAIVVSMALAGKVASLAPVGTKQLAGATVFLTLLGILIVGVYATVQLRELALGFLGEGAAL